MASYGIIPAFGTSRDSFISCYKWIDACHYIQSAGPKAVWAVVQFDSLPAYFVFMSKAGIPGADVRSVHAEEEVIRNFPTILGRSTVLAQGLVRACNIYLSDSPCTVRDPRPSNSFHAVSCTEKLKVLARNFPGLQFNVYFNKAFSYLDQVTGTKHMGEVFIRILLRLTPFFQGKSAGAYHVALLKSLLSDFFPEFDIESPEVEQVIAQLAKVGRSKPFQAGPMECATIVGNTIIKVLARSRDRNQKQFLVLLRWGLSASIMARSIEIFGVLNLTITPRSFTDMPPLP